MLEFSACSQLSKGVARLQVLNPAPHGMPIDYRH